MVRSNFILFVLVAILTANSSCKKNDVVDNNMPVAIKPDTLGVGWKKIKINSGENFNDIFFINNSTGYLAGQKTYKSVDGGNSWTVTSLRSFGNLFATGNGNVFYTMSIGNNLLYDSVYRSFDGGTTVFPYKLDYKATDVFFTDNDNGYSFTLNNLFVTTDGGTTWQRKLYTTPSAYGNIGYCSLFFRNNSLGWLIDGSTIFRTDGSISDWKYTTVGTVEPGTFLTSIYASSDKVVYVINNHGEMYKSTDGGISFGLIKSFNTPIFSDIHFVSDEVGYVTMKNRLYKTTDGGSSWSVEIALGDALLSEVHFVDQNHGWVCGTNGLVLKFN